MSVPATVPEEFHRITREHPGNVDIGVHRRSLLTGFPDLERIPAHMDVMPSALPSGTQILSTSRQDARNE